jgi:hypothetical protein
MDAPLPSTSLLFTGNDGGFSNLPPPALRKGSGWRLGWDPGRSPFVALVGGETWALELTLEEW